MCYYYNKQTKTKLGDENKTSLFFMYVWQIYQMKIKKTRKQKEYFIMVV